MLPPGCPKPVPFKPMWSSEVPKAFGNQEKARQLARKATLNKDFIMLRLEKYIQYWQNGMSKCEGFATAFGPYVDYWICVLSELKEPLPNCGVELLEGFWPQHDWRAVSDEISSPQSRVNPIDIIPEDVDREPY